MNITILALPAKHKNQLVKLLRDRLYTLEYDLEYYKEMIGVYWKNSDRDNPNTAPHFANLNHCKTCARKIRKELKLIRET